MLSVPFLMKKVSRKKPPLKVIARLCGGIGNQLFIYSAAKRLAAANQACLVLDTVSGFKYDRQYSRTYQLHHFNITDRYANFYERLDPFSRLRRKFLIAYNSSLPLEQRSYIKQRFRGFDSQILNLQLTKDIFFDGYWQSQDYFLDKENLIRDTLVFRPPLDDSNQSMGSSILSSNAVCVHVRFFDDNPLQDVNNTGANASLSYYRKAFEYIERTVSSPHYYIFADQPIPSSFFDGFIDHSKITYINHNKGDDNAYADLWLMTLCKHFIIANSTFSWWGAWLSSNTQHKIVVAPSKSLLGPSATWGFDGLLPPTWILL